jgi:hypothetical protein
VTEFAQDASLQDAASSASDADQGSLEFTSDRIPVVRLDPGEIAELRVVCGDVHPKPSAASREANYPSDCEVSSSPYFDDHVSIHASRCDVLLPVSNEEITRSPDSGGDDIVFSSVVKKKVKKCKKLAGEFCLMVCLSYLFYL